MTDELLFNFIVKGAFLACPALSFVVIPDWQQSQPAQCLSCTGWLDQMGLMLYQR